MLKVEGNSMRNDFIISPRFSIGGLLVFLFTFFFATTLASTVFADTTRTRSVRANYVTPSPAASTVTLTSTALATSTVVASSMWTNTVAAAEVSVSSNAATGYSLFMSPANVGVDNNRANLYLNGDTQSFPYIASVDGTVATTVLGDEQWGYAVAADDNSQYGSVLESGSTIVRTFSSPENYVTMNEDISDDALWAGLSGDRPLPVLIAYRNTANTTSDTYKIYFGARVNAQLVSGGTYTNDVYFTVVVDRWDDLKIEIEDVNRADYSSSYSGNSYGYTLTDSFGNPYTGGFKTMYANNAVKNAPSKAPFGYLGNNMVPMVVTTDFVPPAGITGGGPISIRTYVVDSSDNVVGDCFGTVYIEQDGPIKYRCQLVAYDTSGATLTLGKESKSYPMIAASANTLYSIYIIISTNNYTSGRNVVYEDWLDYAVYFKGADATFSNFDCNSARISVAPDTHISDGTSGTYDYILEDERDSKYYIVRKMYMASDNDNNVVAKCWMVQNLDLFLVAVKDSNDTTATMYTTKFDDRDSMDYLMPLNSSNTDMSSTTWSGPTLLNHRFFNARHVGGIASHASDVTFTITGGLKRIAVQDNGTTRLSLSTDAGSYSYNLTYCAGGNTSTNSCDQPGASAYSSLFIGAFNQTVSPSIASELTSDYCAENDLYCAQYRDATYNGWRGTHFVSSYAVGTYYNWYAATAGSGNSTFNTAYANAPDSICPAGWHLPSGRTSTTGTTSVDQNEYAALLRANAPTSVYSSTGGYWDNLKSIYNYKTIAGGGLFTHDEPLSFVAAGANWWDDLSNTGVASRLWTRTNTGLTDASDAYAGTIYDSRLYLGGTSMYRANGIPVRCVSDAYTPVM